MSEMLTGRYRDRLAGALSCYDRIVTAKTLPGICYAAGMTSFLNAKGIRIFDYPRFAEPLRDAVRDRAQALADYHNPDELRRRLDRYATCLCPVGEVSGQEDLPGPRPGNPRLFCDPHRVHLHQAPFRQDV